MHIFKTILLILILFFWHVSQGQKEVYGLADSLIATQDYFGAYQMYSSIFESDTSDKKAVEGMASCLYILGDLQQSKAYYHRLESLDDHKSNAVTRLASIYETQQNIPKAIKYNIALTKLYPNNPVY
ncbi:MAG: hypothetical protein WBO36_12230, partial [Saprospiraceae bacterium]